VAVHPLSSALAADDVVSVASEIDGSYSSTSPSVLATRLGAALITNATSFAKTFHPSPGRDVIMHVAAVLLATGIVSVKEVDKGTIR